MRGNKYIASITMTHYNTMTQSPILERCHEAINDSIPADKRGQSALALERLEPLLETLPDSKSRDLSIRSSEKKDVWALAGSANREKEMKGLRQANRNVMGAEKDDTPQTNAESDRSGQGEQESSDDDRERSERSMIKGGGYIPRKANGAQVKGQSKSKTGKRHESKSPAGTTLEEEEYDPVPAALKSFQETWKGIEAVAPKKTVEALMSNKHKALEGEVFTDILGAMIADMHKQEREKLSTNVLGVVKAASELNTSFRDQVKGLTKACNFFENLGSSLSEEIQECKRLREDAILRQEMSEVERSELDKLQRANDEFIEMFKDIINSHGKFTHTIAAVREIVSSRDKVRAIGGIIADNKFIMIPKESYPNLKLVERNPNQPKTS